MKLIDCDKVAEGLFAFFGAHPELREGSLAASQAHEAEAIALLMAMTANRWAAWAQAHPDAQATARALLMTFFAKVTHPRPGEYLGTTWRVRRGTLQEQALDVLAQEIRKSHPQQARPH
ncbi:MAG: hypothetical protein AB7I35_12185 [Ramlibacter sp.]